MVGSAGTCRQHYYAITGERRFAHPAVIAITRQAQVSLTDFPALMGKGNFAQAFAFVTDRHAKLA